MQWQCRDREIDLTRPVVMGILNVTPDSFSDGGRHTTLSAALERAGRMVEEGAAIVDVGGESTRPGSPPVPTAEQIARVVPVIEGICATRAVAVSIDTSDPAVMRAAVAAGAVILNDVRALREPGAREFAAESQAGVCLMHMQGEPATMQVAPHYADVVGEVTEFLLAERRACLAAGVRAGAIVLDPGLGFGKSFEHNLTLLREMARFTALPAPVLIGVSRKSFVGRMLGRDVHARMYGGLGLAALAVAQGVSVVRTHDVAATWDAIRTVSTVLKGMQ